MQRDVLAVAPEDTIGFAAEQMAERGVGACVVLDYGRLIGILSERDILRAVAGRVHSSEARVREWMTADPVTASESMSAEEAGRIMIEQGFRHLPDRRGRPRRRHRQHPRRRALDGGGGRRGDAGRGLRHDDLALPGPRGTQPARSRSRRARDSPVPSTAGGRWRQLSPWEGGAWVGVLGLDTSLQDMSTQEVRDGA